MSMHVCMRACVWMGGEVALYEITLFFNLQVPLGVLLLNENKIDEMCKILHELHRYVPSKNIHTDIALPDGGTLDHDDYKLYHIYLVYSCIMYIAIYITVRARCCKMYKSQKSIYIILKDK